MSINLPFGTSEIFIGSTKNRIFINDTGDMIFVDGSLADTSFPEGVTLKQVAGLEQTTTLDDLVVTTGVAAGKSYLLLRQSDGTWKTKEFIPPTVTVENLNDVQDVTITTPQDNDVLTYSGGAWKNIPKETVIVIQVEAADWTANSTVIEGDPGYTVTVPHNLGLTLPNDLMEVGLWNLSHESISLHKVKQQTNNVYLESTTALDLYITMRK